MNPIYVSFYTPDYAEHAARLKESLDAFGLDYDLRPWIAIDSWIRNCAQKPSFIRGRLRECQRAIVWIDADAVVRKRPSFEFPDVDIAIYGDAREVRSGTVFVANTMAARYLLDRWTELCAANPNEWDQRMLSRAIGEVPVRLGTLDVSHCFIFDTDRERHPGVEPVIEHFQASRTLKRKEAAR